MFLVPLIAMPSRSFVSPRRTVLQGLIRFLARWRALWIIALAALMLSGCVHYDVGINFDNPNRGEIVQHIRLQDPLTTLSNGALRQWVDDLDRRAHQLQGRTQRVSDREIILIIPFTSGNDLETKFNKFLNPTIASDLPTTRQPELELPDFTSQLKVSQNNFFFVQRFHLSYDLDLRSLGLAASNGNLLFSPDSLLELEFNLHTPWGARNLVATKSKGRSTTAAAPTPVPTVQQQGKDLIWTLNPGQINHLETVFWVPNPLGIGTVLIVLIVVLGTYLKQQFIPTSSTP